MAKLYRFEGYSLHEGRRQLFSGSQELKLSPKAFSTLVVLLARHPDAVSRRELFEGVWGDVVVEDGNLSTVVNEIRSVLGDDGRKRQFVRTVHGIGYAFDKPVSIEETSSPVEVLCRLHWRGGRHEDVSWDGGQVALVPGDHVVGSDLNASICVRAYGVSRQHARIRVTPTQVLIEDLESKNGAFIGSQKIEQQTVLRNGDEIRLGRAILTVHLSRSGGSSTETL